MNPSSVIAYFSMEVGLEPDIPIYSGGLGVLVGDTLRAAADLNIPLVGVTLLHRKGYFRQHLDDQGNKFWSRRYCIDTVGLDSDMILKYVKHQEDKERRAGQ